MSAPSLAWAKAVPPGGAAFYTGTRILEWRGSLMVGVLGAKHLHRVVLSSPIDLTRCRTPDCAPTIDRDETYFLGDPPGGFGRLRDVVMGPDDELYVTTSNCDGRGTCPTDGDKILRITRRPRDYPHRLSTPFPQGKGESSAVARSVRRELVPRRVSFETPLI